METLDKCIVCSSNKFILLKNMILLTVKNAYTVAYYLLNLFQ
jgi:hypothetical protein